MTTRQLPNKIPSPSRLPWGYDRGDDGFAYPNKEMFEKLYDGFDLLDNGQPLREVSDHLEGLGFNISKSSLSRLYLKYRPDGEYLKKLQVASKDTKKKVKTLTKDEKAARKKKIKIAAEKRRITNSHKRIENLVGEKEIFESRAETLKAPVVVVNPLTINQEDVEELQENKHVIFQPHPGPQTEFLSATELEVLYGGAAGGGKSYAIIADPIRYFDNPNFNGLLLRRRNDELRELIGNTKKMYKDLYKDAKFHEQRSEWTFPSGARMWMSYLDRDDDVQRYHGQSFTWIGIDELTQYPTPFAWNFLRSRLRTTDPTLRGLLAMRGTTNPGGPGHGWVKKMFVDPAPPGEAFWATDLDTDEILKDPKTGVPLFKRRFIPAKLSDNPSLYEDGIYERNLLSLSEGQRAQLLDGDWTIADGAAFPEFKISKHVVKPFEIPYTWKKFRAADYGYSSFSCVLWFAINPQEDQLVVYRELYVTGHTGEALSKKVREIERNAGEKMAYGVLDSSVWHKRGEGPSIAEVMIQNGTSWRPSDRSAGSRTAGYNRLHEILKVNDYTEEPGIIFFDNCRHIIADLQVIPKDPNGLDDIDERYKNDHAYDALRYGIMSRPKSSFFFDQQQEKINKYNPNDQVFGY